MKMKRVMMPAEYREKEGDLMPSNRPVLNSDPLRIPAEDHYHAPLPDIRKYI
jgi:hypothetical protein